MKNTVAIALLIALTSSCQVLEKVGKSVYDATRPQTAAETKPSQRKVQASEAMKTLEDTTRAVRGLKELAEDPKKAGKKIKDGAKNKIKNEVKKGANSLIDDIFD